VIPVVSCLTRLGRAVPEGIAGPVAGLAEVIRLFDGALAPTESVSKYFYEPTPIEKERHLLRVFREIRDTDRNSFWRQRELAVWE
jgi:hypothetical protein